MFTNRCRPRPDSKFMAGCRKLFPLFLVLVLVCAAAPAAALCDLTGRWTGFEGDKALYDNYYIQQVGNTLQVFILRK